MGYLLVLAIAIIIWLAISLMILVSYHSREEHHASVSIHEHASTAESKMNLANDVENLELDGDWKKNLEQIAGISGWVLIRKNGNMLDSSHPHYESAGVSLAQMVQWLGDHMDELDVHQPRLLELETKQGSVMILFPRNHDLDAHLILFLDKESYYNHLWEKLSNIDWDTNREGVL